MANLKPRLIMTQSGRKRRGFGKLLFVLLIFAVGFYAGSKYGDSFFESISPKEAQNISLVERADKDQEQQSVKKDSTEKVSTKVHSNLDNQIVEDQKFLALDAQAESSSPYVTQNDAIGTDDSAENALNTGEESGSFIDAGNEQDNPLSDDISEEANNTPWGYTLQVAAFSTPDEANSVAEGYISKGYEAYVVPIQNSRGESWNLVKIGRFNTIDQAFSYSLYFKNREGVEAYVESLQQETVFNESWNNSEQADVD